LIFRNRLTVTKPPSRHYGTETGSTVSTGGRGYTTPEKGDSTIPLTHHKTSQPKTSSQGYSQDRQVAIIDQTFTSTEKCKVNQVQSVSFHVRWENDGADVVDARVYVNGTEHVTNKTGWISFNVAYDTVGERSWVVTDFQHPEASVYTVTVASPA